jgi:hypothetical protein
MHHREASRLSHPHLQQFIGPPPSHLQYRRKAELCLLITLELDFDKFP